jgi:hypothetical protein
MHPWGWHHHHGYYRRGGSRLLWFAIGAGTAAWYIRSKEMREQSGGWGCTWRHRRELESLRQAGAGIDPPPSTRSANTEGDRWVWRAHTHWGGPAHNPETSFTPPEKAEQHQQAAKMRANAEARSASEETRYMAQAEALMSPTPGIPAPVDWEAVKRERWVDERAKAASSVPPEWMEEAERLKAFGKQAEEKVRIASSWSWTGVDTRGQ